jgi:hypothetical protein
MALRGLPISKGLRALSTDLGGMADKLKVRDFTMKPIDMFLFRNAI